MHAAIKETFRRVITEFGSINGRNNSMMRIHDMLMGKRQIVITIR